MHQRLQSSADLPELGQGQQVQSNGDDSRGQHACVAPIAVGLLMKLGVPDPRLALNAQAVLRQLQQGFWGGARVGEKQVVGARWLAVTASAGRDLRDPAGADPGFSDVLRSQLGAQCPGDVTAVANRMMRCSERDLALELAADLAMQRLLIGLDRQEKVGSLLVLSQNGRWVWSASA